jgi:hypothetical protein
VARIAKANGAGLSERRFSGQQLGCLYCGLRVFDLLRRGNGRFDDRRGIALVGVLQGDGTNAPVSKSTTRRRSPAALIARTRRNQSGREIGRSIGKASGIGTIGLIKARSASSSLQAS